MHPLTFSDWFRSLPAPSPAVGSSGIAPGQTPASARRRIVQPERWPTCSSVTATSPRPYPRPPCRPPPRRHHRRRANRSDCCC